MNYYVLNIKLSVNGGENIIGVLTPTTDWPQRIVIIIIVNDTTLINPFFASFLFIFLIFTMGIVRWRCMCVCVCVNLLQQR